MILDYVDNIQLPEESADRHFDARMALGRLAEGLFWLNRTVNHLEHRACAAAAKDDVRLAIAGGILDEQPLGFLSCAFQWYAMSACNYAQLVGWLASGEPRAAKRYLQKVLRRVSQYRNKVAAHLAMAEPRGDNEADLAASVMTQIVYAHGRFYAGSLSPIIEGADVTISVSQDLSWSLTLAHEPARAPILA